MSQNNPQQVPEAFCIEKLLENDSYLIPMYQRNYAWEEGEITQLIQDVVDYQKDHAEKPYYIGTLVVYKRNDSCYETIDGQQRLTTLTLLTAYLKNQKVEIEGVAWPQKANITFENRENSQRTFEAIFSYASQDIAEEFKNHALLNGYQIIERVLPKLVKEKNYETFANYLLKNVQIMRVNVPHDTDLNHYFEIMNSRGEQLEKHEVLKAKLLSALDNGISDELEKTQSKACLNLIWEACANMDTYVQTGFTPAQRTAIFSDKTNSENKWSGFYVSDFDDLREKLNEKSSSSNKSQDNLPSENKRLSLTKIIGESTLSLVNPAGEKKETPQRFEAQINFPNFLLQVLRVYCQMDVPLDDKRLIQTFECHLLKAEADKNKLVQEIKNFAFALLRCKYLFDHYIIKREFLTQKEGWSLQRYKYSENNNSAYYVNTFGQENETDEINRKILMCLAAFHVSTPTQAYKHWLSGALHWLNNQSKQNKSNDGIDGSKYLIALEDLAKSFMLYRYLATSPEDYYKIIFENSDLYINQNSIEDWAKKLTYGNIENNFVFNYLDYLLWKNNEYKSVSKDTEISKFVFKFRSSVEHYYPQFPKAGEKWDSEPLNSFGNLCLISHAKNSSLSNHGAEAKKEHYQKGEMDSIKQYMMMKFNVWNPAAAEEHQKQMLKDLKESLFATSSG